MEQNKVRTYTLYAIGEIALVMVGILLALQVNNWNEERKDREKETDLKAQLHREFSRDLKQLEEKITIRNTLINSAIKLIAYRDEPKGVPNDSIAFHFSRTVYRPTFDPISSEFINRSDLSLIQNYQLRAYLTEWDVNVLQVKEDEYVWRDYRLKNREKAIFGEGVIRNQNFIYNQNNGAQLYLLDADRISSTPFSDTPINIDYKEILTSIDVENYLITCIAINTDGNLNSEVLKDRIITILEMLEES